MADGKIAIFGGGTGNPFFSTDTTTALRAVEVSADIMFKATMVDGVYDKDPHKYPDAKKYDTLTFTKVLEDRLAVMDGTAATLCRDNKLPILVFDLADPDNIAKAVQGENVGTLVYEAEHSPHPRTIEWNRQQSQRLCRTIYNRRKGQ